MPDVLVRNARIVRHSVTIALGELRVVYSWKTWTLGWLSRVLMQVVFFALIGVLLDSPEQQRFLVVGNAVMLAVMEAMFVVPSTTWERRTGTLPLLVAAPASTAVTFFGRSLQWLPSGLVTSCVGLFVVAPVFGVRWSLPEALLAVPVVAVVAFSTYCFGLVLGALVLRAMDVRNIVSNLAWLTIMTVCGVQVPVDFWPAPVAVVAQVLPVTHGLAAVRALADGSAGPAYVAGQVGLELVVAVGWLAVATVVLLHLAESGRRDGSIEYAD